jgi:hypothetical protein
MKGQIDKLIDYLEGIQEQGPDPLDWQKLLVELQELKSRQQSEEDSQSTPSMPSGNFNNRRRRRY